MSAKNFFGSSITDKLTLDRFTDPKSSSYASAKKGCVEFVIIYERMNKWMNERMNEWMNEWMNEMMANTKVPVIM